MEEKFCKDELIITFKLVLKYRHKDFQFPLQNVRSLEVATLS